MSTSSDAGQPASAYPDVPPELGEPWRLQPSAAAPPDPTPELLASEVRRLYEETGKPVPLTAADVRRQLGVGKDKANRLKQGLVKSGEFLSERIGQVWHFRPAPRQLSFAQAITAETGKSTGNSPRKSTGKSPRNREVDREVDRELTQEITQEITVPQFTKLSDAHILACGVGPCPTHEYRHIQFKFGRFECSFPTAPGQWCNTPVDGAPPQLINPGRSTPTVNPEGLPGLVNSDSPAGNDLPPELQAEGATGFSISYWRRRGKLPYTIRPRRTKRGAPE